MLVAVYLAEGLIGAWVVQHHGENLARVAAIYRGEFETVPSVPAYPWIAWSVAAGVCAVGLVVQVTGWRARVRLGPARGPAITVAGAASAHLGGLTTALLPFVYVARLWWGG